MAEQKSLGARIEAVMWAVVLSALAVGFAAGLSMAQAIGWRP